MATPSTQAIELEAGFRLREDAYPQQQCAPRPNTSLRESRLRPRVHATRFEGKLQRKYGAPDAEEYESHRRCIEELKAELGTLRYSLSTIEQEKEMAEARHKTEIEDQRRRAQEDFEKKQAAEAESAKVARQLESVQAELRELRDAATQDKSTFDKRVRDAEAENRLLTEQMEELVTAKDDAARINEKKVMDIQMELDTAKRDAQELEQETASREAMLQTTQTQLAEKDNQIGSLEADVLRLKAQTGDAETMAVIKRELTEQVQHIRRLEATNREQLSELRHLRQIHKAVEVVEEEKRMLQRKLEAAETLEAELDEARIQRQRLEDERLAWTAYLQSAAESGGEDMQFESPEELARALVRERLTSASYVEQMGTLQADVAAHESTIQALEEEKAELRAEVEKAKDATVSSVAVGGDKLRARLERQRALATKEVEYLRAQLKTFDAEDLTFQPEQHDQVRAQRIQELEDLVDQYKAEVQALHGELSAPAEPVTPVAGSKRQRSVEPAGGPSHEQMGQLVRKNRKLQDEFTALQTKLALSEKELFEAVKTSTLEALKKENAELLAHMQNPKSTSSFPTMPASMLEAAQRQVREARAETASAQKSAKRLKEVWTAKSAEFKEAIFSTLGWTVTFIPNGKMRVESVYYPSQTDEHENSIVFDGEKGTMKVGGGPRSAFAQRIDDQIKFWVREKGCIPGFLAALTLEFYDEHSKAPRD
ncbi:unnamed protein product [Parascedosporium putredinis]|uniref:Spindle assembly checkpoint component MAD1 n=1 Tax=Parascedosporium putredinis TaxID=1442378 RepID=A0A9P1H2T4_9PEZI|nr:unnamed protein product [Parascedosporium putredinis]CAI7995122.1 unnamed protein product [Parascedosporium putredinis]